MSKQILKGPEITNIPNYATLGQLLYDSTEKYKNRICQVKTYKILNSRKNCKLFFRLMLTMTRQKHI